MVSKQSAQTRRYMRARKWLQLPACFGANGKTGKNLPERTCLANGYSMLSSFFIPTKGAARFTPCFISFVLPFFVLFFSLYVTCVIPGINFKGFIGGRREIRLFANIRCRHFALQSSSPVSALKKPYLDNPAGQVLCTEDLNDLMLKIFLRLDAFLLGYGFSK